MLLQGTLGGVRSGKTRADKIAHVCERECMCPFKYQENNTYFVLLFWFFFFLGGGDILSNNSPKIQVKLTLLQLCMYLGSFVPVQPFYLSLS